MKEIKDKPIITNHLWVIYIIALLAIALLFYFNWLIGLIGAILLIMSFYYMYLSEKRYQYDQLEYISNLSYRVEGVGNRSEERRVGKESRGCMEWVNYNKK